MFHAIRTHRVRMHCSSHGHSRWLTRGNASKQANGNNCSRHLTAPKSNTIFSTDGPKLPLKNISQVARQSIDMHSAPCGTVAASSQGALHKNKPMATIAGGVRLHQCHITYLERIERNCHSGIFVKLQCKALTCTAPPMAQLQRVDMP
jgi:hypothetical protein